jgi:hypothetical protein
MSKTKLGLSLLEIIIAIFFMSIAILSFFTMNQASNRSSMDAYYEFLAFSLAKEPIEVFRGFNYDYLAAIVFQGAASPAIYPTDGSFHEIPFDPTIDMQYPSEAALFQRKIELSSVEESGIKGIKIKVTVSVKGSSRAEVWMSNKAVDLEAVILERPK